MLADGDGPRRRARRTGGRPRAGPRSRPARPARRAARRLISADLALAARIPYLEYGYTADPWAEQVASLERVAALDVRLLLAGHGSPTTDAAGPIAAALAAVEDAPGLILAAISDEPLSAFEAIEAVLDPDVLYYPRQVALSGAMCILERLERLGAVPRSGRARRRSPLPRHGGRRLMAVAPGHEPPPVETVAALLDRAAELSAGEAIVGPDERATYPELAGLTRLAARRLLAAGVERGDRVGLLNTDRIEALAMLFGAMRIGAVPVPVNARYKARELSYVVANAGMQLLLLDPQFAPLLADADLPESCRVVVGLDEPAFVAAGESVDDEELGRAEAAVRPDDPALILYTSGTTANPKGCVYNHYGMAARRSTTRARSS